MYSSNLKKFTFLLLLLCLSGVVGVVSIASDDCPEADELLLSCAGKFLSHELDNAPEPSYPPLGQYSTQNKFGAYIRRVSDNAYLQLANGLARHHYSRRQVWNSDETLMLIANKIIDYKTLDIIDSTIGITNSLNWSNRLPDTMFGLRRSTDGINEFVEYNVFSGESNLIWKFSEYESCSLGHGKGNLSADDRFALISCTNNDDDITMFALDLILKQVIGQRKAGEQYKWASFSASGKYVVVQNSSADDRQRELLRYNRDLTDEQQLLDFAEHGDLGLDDRGDDVFVLIGIDFIYSVRLHDGKRARHIVSGLPSMLTKGETGLDRLGFGHVSCRNIKRPGWCYVSSFNEKLIGAVKIGFRSPPKSHNISSAAMFSIGVNAVEQWGFHNSSSDTYAAQPKISVSPSGQKLIITSDINGTSDVNDYVYSINAN